MKNNAFQILLMGWLLHDGMEANFWRWNDVIRRLVRGVVSLNVQIDGILKKPLELLDGKGALNDSLYLTLGNVPRYHAFAACLQEGSNYKRDIGTEQHRECWINGMRPGRLNNIIVILGEASFGDSLAQSFNILFGTKKNCKILSFVISYENYIYQTFASGQVDYIPPVLGR